MESAFGDRRDWRCQIIDAHPTVRTLLGPCYGSVNGHEVLPRGRGGSITDPSNIVLLCDRHNEWCSANPVEAHRLGLLKHAWEDGDER